MASVTLTLAEAAAAVGGEIRHGDSAQVIGEIAIDSRSLGAGDFFVAIRGERFDGHRFLADAMARGAAGALVDDLPEEISARLARQGVPLIVAADTTAALQALAREVRRRSGSIVVAITGSAGKTTTKEITADFLAARYAVFRNRGNFNNHIGLPLSLLALREGPDVAVVELGMNHAGEIRALVGIAAPDVRVWTNVGDAHLGYFDSPDAIADAKAEILAEATAQTTLIVNANDARVMSRVAGFPGRVITFGIDTPADIEACAVEALGLDGTVATLRTPVGEARLQTPLLGRHNLSNVLAAAGVAIALDVPLSVVIERAKALRPALHRGELLRLPGGVTIVDDSYNSSPAALAGALETIGAATGSARKAAVLGEMLELGVHAERLHVASGRAAAAAGLDWLVTVGGAAAQAMAGAAVSAGMRASTVLHAATRQEAAQMVLGRVRAGDLVLVKGSRGIGVDLVVESMQVEFA